MTTHTLMGMAARTGTDTTTSASVPLAGRTKLTFALLLAAVTGALSVDVQFAAVDTDDAYTTVATFAGLNAPGTTTKVNTTDFTVEPYHRFARVKVTGITTATFEVKLTAPWVDTTADAALFSKELRSFADGLARLASDAEDIVMAELKPRVNVGRTPMFPGDPYAPLGEYRPLVVDFITTEQYARLGGVPADMAIDADMTLDGFGDTIRAAIIRQAEHGFQRFKLSQRDDPTALVSLRQFPRLAPDLMEGLGRYRNETSNVWRGR